VNYVAFLILDVWIQDRTEEHTPSGKLEILQDHKTLEEGLIVACLAFTEAGTYSVTRLLIHRVAIELGIHGAILHLDTCSDHWTSIHADGPLGSTTYIHPMCKPLR
jgi:hypothetical protein